MDWWDYGHPDSADPAVIVDQLARRGVHTLFLETGLWDKPQDVLYPAEVNVFLDHSHARGIKVEIHDYDLEAQLG